MVEHTQTIRRQIADELFESVWPFYGVEETIFSCNGCMSNNAPLSDSRKLMQQFFLLFVKRHTLSARSKTFGTARTSLLL